MTGYQDAALLYWERGFAPIPVRNKRPVPAGATGRNGVVDEAKIQDWIKNGFRYKDPETQEWATQPAATANTALRAQAYIAIDVDEYGDKHGHAQLQALEAQLGPLPATPSSTARGEDSLGRQHFLALPYPVELHGKPPIPGLDANDIHIEIVQSHHRYSLVWPSIHPETGEQYRWYDADGALMELPPHIDDLEYLPEAWIEFLSVPEREHGHSAEQWDGEMPAVASETEQRKLHAIISSLRSLPDVWSPGSGWHDTVIRAACWLWRIARSNAYALTPEQGFQLMLDHTPIDETQGGLADLTLQWESAESITAGQFEEPPLDDRPPLLPWAGFPTDRAFPSINGEHFASIWMHLPENTTSAGLWGRRQQLLVALLSSGFTDQEAATMVWHSAAAAHPGYSLGGVLFVDPDSRIITEHELWREVDKAKEEAARASGATVEAAPADERPNLDAIRNLSFLNDPERQVLAGPDGIWWGLRMIEWARTTFSHVNEPYYRMNRWMILSIIFSPKAVLPRPGGNDRPLNLYMAIVGTTTSGKTEALRVGKNAIKAYFLMADSPDIGGNHTPESLAETLVAKDGQATWFHMDEAHTKIATWKKPTGPYTEMPGVITDVYDGDVGAIYRATKKEISGKAAKAFMTVHFMGTPMGMADVMGPDDWESGFLNRFVWGIGDRPVDTLESVAGDWIDEDGLEDDESVDTSAGLKIFQQWAAEFASASQKVSKGDGKQARMRLPRAVIERHRQFAWDLNQLAQQHKQYTERLRPTFRRLGETVMRCAALVALSRGRVQIEMSDLLIAIEQAEEWAQNILIMVEATDESLRTRDVNMIERAIIHNGGSMTLASIHRLPRFRNRRREVEDLIGELVAQGRAERDKSTPIELVKTKGIIDERSAA